MGGAANGSPAGWNAHARCVLSDCILGRVGNAGGVSSSAAPLLLLVGLLKGDALSLSSARLGCEKRVKRAAPMSGFSARLTGGGTGLAPSLISRSRRSSADRLGRGGDGG